jgi:hypothetical protein
MVKVVDRFDAIRTSQRARAVVGDLHAGRRERDAYTGRVAVPYHVRHTFADDPPEQLSVAAGHPVHRGRDLGRDSSRSQYRPSAGELTGQGHAPVSLDRGSHIAERIARQPFYVGDLFACPLVITPDQSTRQLGFHADRGKAVPDEVMQVPGEAQPLFGDGQLGELLPRFGEFAVPPQYTDQAPRR